MREWRSLRLRGREPTVGSRSWLRRRIPVVPGDVSEKLEGECVRGIEEQRMLEIASNAGISSSRRRPGRFALDFFSAAGAVGGGDAEGLAGSLESTITVKKPSEVLPRGRRG